MHSDKTHAQHPFTEAPAPWKCKGTLFWLFGYVSATSGYPSRAFFGDLEANSSFSDPQITGEFKGGFFFVMIVRYTETPVGPYDELVLIPGEFAIPHSGRQAQRITRIYVSTKDSVYNGRKNWNIPKCLAHFTFISRKISSPNDLPYSHIEVAPTTDPGTPFFSVNLVPTLILSRASIPFNTKFTPIDTTLALPPLTESSDWQEDAMVGTDRWAAIHIMIRGRAGLMRCSGGLAQAKYGDGVGFPDIRPWSWGMWLHNFDFDFPVAWDPTS